MTEENLLQRCLGGFTQNANESLNSKIWKIAPKTNPGSRRIVEIASDIAVTTFNDGAESLLRISEILGLKIGLEGHNYCITEDANRLKLSRIQARAASKEARAARRQDNHKQTTIVVSREDVQYEAGIAD